MKTIELYRKLKIRSWGLLGVLILGVILSLTFFADSALAARSLTMKQIVVDAQVMPDASMLVTERLTVDFSGQWNGFNIKIPQGDTPIVEETVMEKGKPYILNPGTKYGPPGTYLPKTEGNQIIIDWSIAASDEVRTFDVSYRVKNAVKIHSDSAELYRKFISGANGNKLAKVQVNLKLPAGADQFKQGEDIKIWGHGPLYGEVNFTGPEAIVWSVNNLPAYTFLEGRVVMPVALFTAAPAEAYTKQARLGAILAEEARWANEANQDRLKAKAEYLGGAGIVVGALAAVFLLWRRFGRRHTASFTGDYYRELPASYSPAELSVLWNFNKLKAQDITATILDLARRKFLYLQEDYVRWQAFKKFLQHFSEMQRHEIPSLIIWEHYLVLAVTLGVAKEVIKQLELVFPNMQDENYRFGYGWMTYGAYGSLNSLHHSFEGIGSSFDRSLQSAQKAVSKTSSGSGGGGGFSSGGGGGGGGSSYEGR